MLDSPHLVRSLQDKKRRAAIGKLERWTQVMPHVMRHVLFTQKVDDIATSFQECAELSSGEQKMQQVEVLGHVTKHWNGFERRHREFLQKLPLWTQNLRSEKALLAETLREQKEKERIPNEDRERKEPVIVAISARKNAGAIDSIVFRLDDNRTVYERNFGRGNKDANADVASAAPQQWFELKERVRIMRIAFLPRNEGGKLQMDAVAFHLTNGKEIVFHGAAKMRMEVNYPQRDLGTPPGTEQRSWFVFTGMKKPSEGEVLSDQKPESGDEIVELVMKEPGSFTQWGTVKTHVIVGIKMANGKRRVKWNHIVNWHAVFWLFLRNVPFVQF